MAAAQMPPRNGGWTLRIPEPEKGVSNLEK